MTKKISLNKEWNYSDSNNGEYKKILVPSELYMQGIEIKHDKPFYLMRKIKFDKSWNGKDIEVEFQGVYSEVTVFTSDDLKRWEMNYVSYHYGGFTPFKIDITDLFVDGFCTLVLMVVDPLFETSMASGYARHPIGGILRDVELHVLPKKRITNIKLLPIFNKSLDKFTLNIKSFFKNDKPAKIRISDENFDETFDIKYEDANILLENIQLWNDEIPHRYNISFTSKSGNNINFKYGFRKIEILGTRMLINNKRIFLRGVNRHDLDSKGGRVATKKNDLLDIKLLKELNVNFVRTSHYPATKLFLDLCDEYGIYVENESPTCFIGVNQLSPMYQESHIAHRPDFKEKFISQYDEMIDYSFNNCSIIMWSIGNENNFGKNFESLYIHAKKNNDMRPILYSYPGTKKGTNEKMYEILSMHYPESDGNLNQWGIQITNHEFTEMPVLYDEFAHVPAYNFETLKEDINVKTYWGDSVKQFVEDMYKSNSVLGGAIWCFQDEIFNIPRNIYSQNHWVWENSRQVLLSMGDGMAGRSIGYGTWGLVDIFRERKDEFFFAKKAYSPIFISKNKLDVNDNKIHIHNRYAFIPFKDIEVIFDNGIEKFKTYIHIDAYAEGQIEIPKSFMGKEFDISFSRNNEVIYSEKIIFINNVDYFEVTNNDKKILNVTEFKKSLRKSRLTFEGVHHIVRGKADRNWVNYIREVEDTKHSIEFMKDSIYVKNIVNKNRAKLSVSSANDEIFIKAEIEVKTKKTKDYIPWSFEQGLLFRIDDSFTSMRWEREGTYNDIPKKNIGSLVGEVSLESTSKYDVNDETRTNPDSNLNRSSSYLYGDDNYNKNNDLLNGARSSKSNIRKLSLNSKDGKLEIFFNGIAHTRVFKSENKKYLAINGFLDYPALGWGNKVKRELAANKNINIKIKHTF